MTCPWWRPRWSGLVAATLLSRLTVSAFVFEGSRTSYAQFRKWDGGGNSDITFEFRTEEPSGLLLYTDDALNCDFLELKLVDGALRLRFNYGAGGQIMTVGERLHTDSGGGPAWHKVAVRRRGNTTTLSVDRQTRSAVCSGKDQVFGNVSTNSYFYVGGLPSWYSTKLKVRERETGHFVFSLSAAAAGRRLRMSVTSGAGGEMAQKSLCDVR